MKRRHSDTISATPIPPPSPPNPFIPPDTNDDYDDSSIAAKTPKVINLQRLRKLQKLLAARQEREQIALEKYYTTPEGRFQKKIAASSFPEEQELLWDQLQKVSKKHRVVAEKMLIYLVIYQKDLIQFATNGELIIHGHPIPGSNVAVSLDALLSSPGKDTPAIGELTLLQALKHAPKGLWDLISSKKKRWIMHKKPKVIKPSQVEGAPPAEANDEIIQLTRNKNDGVIIKPDQTARFNRAEHDQGLVPGVIEPKKVTIFSEPWYKVLD